MTWTTTWTFPPSSADVLSVDGLLSVPFAGGAEGWFSGRRSGGFVDANLAHHVPHAPDRLAAARDRVAELTGTEAATWHLMRQVHGARVAVVDEVVPVGAELRDVDVLVTDLAERPLVVLSADCVPILAAGRRAVGAAHAGWRGVVAGAPDALVTALVDLGERPEDVHVALGPAIGPCCYAVGPEVVAAVAAVCGDAVTSTSAGQPSVDLHRAVRSRLEARGVATVVDVAGDRAACTACDDAWFSHRRDPSGGRQAGIVVRRDPDRAGGGR
jgi:YfiH family protein